MLRMSLQIYFAFLNTDVLNQLAQTNRKVGVKQFYSSGGVLDGFGVFVCTILDGSLEMTGYIQSTKGRRGVSRGPTTG